jgi:hypothetical protein
VCATWHVLSRCGGTSQRDHGGMALHFWQCCCLIARLKS